MGLHFKFGVFFIGVNLLFPSFTQALVIEPVTIDSSQGEPLYAEIPFYHAESNTPIKVSIAQPFEMGRPEVINQNQFSHLNFYIRQNSQGDGVIVITSSRPIQENNIDIALKIIDGGQTRFQQIRARLPSRIDRLQATLNAKPLQPKIIQNENDIALNLPTAGTIPNAPSSQNNTDQALVVQRAAPPPLLKNNSISKSSSSPALVVTAPSPQSVSVNGKENTATARVSPQAARSEDTQTASAPMTAHKTTPQPLQTDRVNASNLSIDVTRRATNDSNKPVQTTATSSSETMLAKQTNTSTAVKNNQTASNTNHTTSKPRDTSSHLVKANESLWGIAINIAQQQNIPVQQVMQQIQAQNQHAFINGNANRLKQGVVLNLPGNYPVSTAQVKKQPAKTEQVPALAKNQSQPPIAQKQTDAHMSIVANDKGAIQGSDKNSAESKQRHELTVQVQQQRQAALGLQNNVLQLDQQLKSKERRIALLNARLAELQQQLKSKEAGQKDAKTTSHTTSKSQSIVPALITGTVIAFAGLNSDFAITTLLQELV
ncbi:MAG: hypothetical protein LKF82_09180 [Acinetobacter populi]|jgi:FimV-like protein|uniref:type IV pilus assembly protein FimV n=1 Tax=Acinetobacter populi TaxID=1582270 RepID=UPI002355CAF7|nr:FimV/HubP family polar landmark protein [Acinetobacter populi]MCH4247993.1 hypothetical protein [Acinetobacter populi]